jgi:hypothetical protein
MDCIDDNHNHNHSYYLSNYVIRCSWGSCYDQMIIVCFLWFYSVCVYYAALGSNFKVKAWNFDDLQEEVTLRLNLIIFSTPWIAPIVGMIIEAKSTILVGLWL